MVRLAQPLPGKSSIAVLPFTNLSDDPSQEYFADGMAEDLITDLSKISGLFVISRNSAFTYKGKTVKVRQVAEDLGVRYVLEGNVRRVGNEVRINAQLIDATTGGHLWAETFDGPAGAVFALQDRINAKIVSALTIGMPASLSVASWTVKSVMRFDLTRPPLAEGGLAPPAPAVERAVVLLACWVLFAERWMRLAILGRAD